MQEFRAARLVEEFFLIVLIASTSCAWSSCCVGLHLFLNTNVLGRDMYSEGKFQFALTDFLAWSGEAYCQTCIILVIIIHTLSYRWSTFVLYFQPNTYADGYCTAYELTIALSPTCVSSLPTTIRININFDKHNNLTLAISRIAAWSGYKYTYFFLSCACSVQIYFNMLTIF